MSAHRIEGETAKESCGDDWSAVASHDDSDDESFGIRSISSDDGWDSNPEHGGSTPPATAAKTRAVIQSTRPTDAYVDARGKTCRSQAVPETASYTGTLRQQHVATSMHQFSDDASTQQGEGSDTASDTADPAPVVSLADAAGNVLANDEAEGCPDVVRGSADRIAPQRVRQAAEELREAVRCLRPSGGNLVESACDQVGIVVVQILSYLDKERPSDVDYMVLQWVEHANSVMAQVRELFEHGHDAQSCDDATSMLVTLVESKRHFIGLFADYCVGSSFSPDAADDINILETRAALSVLHAEIQASLVFISTMQDSGPKHEGLSMVASLEKALSMVIVSLAANSISFNQSRIPKCLRITQDTLDIARTTEPEFFGRQATELAETRDPVGAPARLDEDSKIALLAIMGDTVKKVLEVLFPRLTHDDFCGIASNGRAHLLSA